MTHVMMSLKTMGNGPDAAIVSIGAVRWDREGVSDEGGFYRVVNLRSSVRAGGSMDPGVVLGWISAVIDGDNLNGRDITGVDGVLLETALKDLNEWLRQKRFEGMWFCGVEDGVLMSAYGRLGWTPPWVNSLRRNFETLESLSQGVLDVGAEVSALGCAIACARRAAEIMREIGL